MTHHMTECFGNKCSCQPDDYGHMPECMTHSCICSLLLAREQRVEEEMSRAWQQTVDVAVAYARTSTLDAAREAVEAVENDPDAEVDYDRDYAADPTGNCRNPRIWLRSALAAIDALRGES